MRKSERKKSTEAKAVDRKTAQEPGKEPENKKKLRIPGRLEGKISYSPDAFDPLTDQELKDLGFEDLM